ncbi:ABC transporter ATP-binding protein [Halorubrum sp. Hd13]|uniref:ABC transporter ATP-binding protein n=1 Tax=Halorubrum sp. Hd13 TaxID=1480728 RepID=UPI000B980AD6|nr:ABC transporter ATP-binding protein [Halorubrum sp. Hd13]OYR46146.1 multidrug ABC transporter permease [Halorubrum sp. Hd13]
MSDIPLREKLHGLYLIASYRPRFTAAIVGFGVLTALLEGVGVTLIVPLIEVAQSSGAPPDGGIAGLFARIYQLLGLPFTVGSIVLGVGIVLTVRYLFTFLSEWARVHLRTHYVSDLQTRGFENTLDARIAYFDREGSDDILNAIVTQAQKAGEAIEAFVRVFQRSMLILMYLAIALYLAPLLTILSAGFVGLLTFGLRNTIESAYTIGDRVADANEKIQQAVQAGTQGIREVKTLGYDSELRGDFSEAMNQYVGSSIRVKRNEALIGNAYNLSIALLIFGLIYAAFVFTSMSFGVLGAFLFVMFKLGPAVSGTNKRFYQLEGMLPHLVRTEEFIQNLRRNPEIEGGDEPVPADPSPVEFRDVSFSYEGTEDVLSDVSFQIDSGEFIAFVGESGAGKSTIASLLVRLYEPDSGQILAGGRPVSAYDIDEWRSRVAYVRQNPFIFNTTLEGNLRIANPHASRRELERVCEIAQVTEFVDDLPNGYETELGDDGVRLSGGQRQRVALARALLEDADVLVLDEATSDLDTNIEARVQAGIESMDRDFMTLAIAHRLSTISDADRIYTVQAGKIVERGEHESLIEEEGQYAELYSAQ